MTEFHVAPPSTTEPVLSPPKPLDAHQHSWEPVGTASEERVMYSPVSALDHQVQTVTYAVLSCKCGAVKRTPVSAGKVRWLNR